MTKTLETAIERLKALPEAEQEYLAQLLLDEMEADDAKWEALTSKHADRTSRCRGDAANSMASCEPLDPENL